ncbi:putative transcriptional regulatory protein C1F7.11c [Psilocybe cubensis]|uniref:Transcriptional regulatory protein C1F7.11c n=1 Tax=Psilocybe cubensis TaxID=181762 RepID=A0ACB8GH46_PSICU|nr:putative transcriptional regulatory protein C1F7.11c [Psilocybe cubensis]KAH9474722.1 putative transcriptional regulatory protein C1F7.11c [Psilocybe cubensis]
MPQAAKKDNQTQRAQDKESKRARGALSCAECRRLKLKCDKTVPCSSCKRRGCSAICPNGSLITGQGTRFVLADTETLHQKIAQMSDRIRQLEDALAILQSTVAGPGGEPHPLLHRDLLKIKSSIELHSASGAAGEDPPAQDGAEEDEDGNAEYIDAFGTLAIRDDGAATFYGRSAGSEGEISSEASSTHPTSPSDRDLSPPLRHLSAAPSYSDFSVASSSPHQHFANRYPQQPYNPDGSLPNAITSFASGFPLAPSLSAGSSSAASVMSSPSSFGPSSLTPFTHSQKHTLTLQDLTSQYLPPFVDALRLVNLYLEQAPWFFGAVTQRQIEQELMPLWYEEAASAVPSTSTPPAGGLVVQTSPGSGVSTPPTPRTGTSHDLALLFIVFCFGALTDINLPSPPDNAPAEKYYQLTKVALTLDPAAPNGVPVATVQTLSLMAIYEGMCSGENSIETTWALMGLACKLSQSVYRDCARWKLTPAEVQKRRALFWELFITDCWQSLATGRLATFSLPFVDCELPADPDQTIAEDGSVQPSFPYWKARFGAECVSAVVQGTLTSRAPKYSIILDLDRKVRDMDLPAYAQGPPPQGLGLAQTMSHFMPQNYRELTLLYIHRCFFAHAISSNPLDPIKSQYAPSFLAGYRSACTIIASVKLQFSMFPAQIARFWVLWTHAFSASVMLASVATHSSRSKIALAALLELKTACELFESAASYGGRAVKFLPILKRLQGKAQTACRNANSGVPAPIPNDIFKPSQTNEPKDELSIFSGKTHTLSTKATPTGGTSAQTSSTASGHSAPPRASSKSSRASSDSPKAIAEYPSFANVHPSLVSELSVFHGHIKTQIQNAYQNGNDLFSGSVPMVVDAPPRVPAPQPKISPQPPQPQYPAQVHPPQAQYLHQQQTMYHAQMKQEQFERQEEERIHMERMEQERREMERREMERREMERREMERREMEQRELERQEMERQQQMKQQIDLQRRESHHYEVQRQQQLQQEALHRQQHSQQYDMRHQQRPEELRQLEEVQQHQPHQAPQYHSQTYEATPPHSSYGAMPPAPSSSHSQPRRSIVDHNPYRSQQQPQQHYQTINHHPPPLPPHTVPSQHHQQPPQHLVQSQHTGQHEPPHQQQHTMYNAPPSSHHPSPEGMSSSSSVGYSPPTATYSSAPAPAPAQLHMQPQAPPTGSYTQESSPAYVPETYTYWPAASSSFAMPDQRSTGPGYTVGPAHAHHQQYTPENALRGIAADDRGLQETWQSYMNKVGTPRQFFED